MPRRIRTVRFDQPPTLGELCEALEDLRAEVGNAAVPRVLGVMEFNIESGPRIAAINVEVP